jgi:hypothetical protein
MKKLVYIMLMMMVLGVVLIISKPSENNFLDYINESTKTTSEDSFLNKVVAAGVNFKAKASFTYTDKFFFAKARIDILEEQEYLGVLGVWIELK